MLSQNFPAVTELATAHRARRLLDDERFLLILDGFDELAGPPDQAAAQFRREIPDECRTIVLSRHREPELLVSDNRFASYELGLPDGHQVAAYFNELQDQGHSLPGEFLQALADHDAELLALLRSPLQIHLVRSALEKGLIPAGDLMQRLDEGPWSWTNSSCTTSRRTSATRPTSEPTRPVATCIAWPRSTHVPTAAPRSTGGGSPT